MPYRDDIPFTIDQVAGILNLVIKRNTPSELQVNCPFCHGRNGQPDTKGHMSLDLRYDRFRCYRCGKSGGKIALYAEMNNMDNKTAYRELMDILVGKKDYSPARKPPIPIPTVETELRASLNDMDFTYRRLLDLLTLTTKHQENLRGRGLTDEEIKRLGYRSVPCVGHRRIASLLLSQGCKLEGVPGFYVDENGEWKLNVWLTGIMMPAVSIDGRIQGIQVRKDDPDENCKNRFHKGKKKFDKCYWLTGKDKPKGTRVKTRAHFSGVSPDTDTVYVTEGIMKADIAAFLGSKFFVSIPGVSQYEAFRDALTDLKGLGHIKNVAIAWDMDMYDNDAVMDSLHVICQMATDTGFGVRKLNWKREHKGIDDYLKWMNDTKKGGCSNEAPC